MNESYTPPNPYAPQLHAASAANESNFEDRWKANRRRELEAEGARLNAHIEATPFPRMTAAEAARFAAPDPYKPGLDKMRSEG